MKTSSISGTLVFTLEPAVSSLTRSDPNKPSSTLNKLLKCFSLQTSFKALTNTSTKPGQVLCLNGIRVLSINWVVLTHSYRVYINLAADQNYILDGLALDLKFNRGENFRLLWDLNTEDYSPELTFGQTQILFRRTFAWRTKLYFLILSS